MAHSEPTVLLDGLCFPEGPRWHDGRLFFSDMHAHEVVAVDLNGCRETIVQVPQRPSGLGFLADGGMLVVSMVDRRLLRFDGTRLEPVAELGGMATFHCNDMVVDASGRAYVGNFGFDLYAGEAPRATCLVLVSADGQARVVADDLMFPNGTVITADGRTLIIAESFATRLTAFDIAADGSLSHRRVWATLPVVPDGICLDAEGCVWVANPMPPGGFVRVAEGGEIKDRIDLDDRAGFACMLGGPQRRTLFLLEAFSGDPEKSLPGNGRIRTVEVDVPGAGLP